MLLYRIFIALYIFIIRIASIGNKKAREWVNGRQHLFEQLEARIGHQDKVIWVHCSSAGEFEQGKPIIERLKQEHPSFKILVTFFSPSGYAIGRNYPYADICTYLPADTPFNAKRFLQTAHPVLAIFVKYEFWHFHLKETAQRKIPLLLISAVFRKEQSFFKWYGQFFRSMLFYFTHIFVQDKTSLALLVHSGISHCSQSGDTRFDRVNEIASRFYPVPGIAEFTGNQPSIVAGSTWEGDEQVLAAFIRHSAIRLIIAPHEIDEHHITKIEQLFPGAVRYSKISSVPHSNVLIIDNVGMLSRLYAYSTIAYVGGGFTKDGIHNILEAAVYGKPVLFGPNFKKYREATELIQCGGAFSISNQEEFTHTASGLMQDNVLLERTGKAASKYIMENTGATEAVLGYIQENRLLTN